MKSKTNSVKAVTRDTASAARQGEILRELHRHGTVLADDLVTLLKSSRATIRRDLTELELSGFLRRTHGGAVLIELFLYEPFRHLSSFREREQQHLLEKRLIGMAAAEMVSAGETIALTAGTTTTQVARNLRQRKGLTVITNAVNIAMELSLSGVKVWLTGGDLGDWFALTGSAGIAAVGEVFVDMAFIGVDGAHPVHGFTTNYPAQAAIHQAVLRQARQRIALADHSKIGVVATALICPPGGVDLLITDRNTPEKKIAPFLKKGVKVRLV